VRESKLWIGILNKVSLEPRGDSHIKRAGALGVPFGGRNAVVLVPLRVFSLKRSTAGAFAVPFRVSSQKI